MQYISVYINEKIINTASVTIILRREKMIIKMRWME